MRIVIFGNSGSGKSTLAKHYAEIPGVIHLDLDTLAWKEDEFGVRESIKVSKNRIESFTTGNEKWVIEGCYASLLPIAMAKATEIIFLDPGVDACLENCRARPWERHKYSSQEEQDNHLEMLLDWVTTYKSRTDEFSYLEHKSLFEAFERTKQRIGSNGEAQRRASEVKVTI